MTLTREPSRAASCVEGKASESSLAAIGPTKTRALHTSARGLTLVGASAGSGKTYRLSREVSDSLAADAQGMSPQALVAVTYTTKAQAELESRLRRDLVARGLYTRAESLPLAYLGTVHSVCL